MPRSQSLFHALASLAPAAALAACLAALPATPAHALTVEEQDCREGSDFIANAARARDAGMSAERFKARLEEDLILIRAYPPQLRWFARDEDDAQILREWVDRVFDGKPTPLEIQRRFLAACREQAALVQARRGAQPVRAAGE
jgi:hypothetical protein